MVFVLEKEILSNTFDIINNLTSSKKYSKYCQIYSFTTENISGYYENFDFKDKKVLTICASGDHVFNAILLGANYITCFDINLLSKYYFNLKRICINFLSYEEFIEYFMLGTSEVNNNVFNYNLYLKISRYIDEDTKLFWDSIYSEYNNDGFYIRHSNLFNNKYDNTDLKVNSNTYLTKEKFDLLKRNILLVQVEFINSNITDLMNKLNKKYDIIMLSNLSDYINGMYKDNYLINFYKYIIKPLKQFLTNKGLLIYAYIYDFDIKKEKYRSDIDNYSKVLRVINKTKLYKFKSVIDSDKKDAILYIEED